MALKNTENSYGWLAKLFHWGVGLLVIILLVAGNVMVEMDNTPDKFELYQLHKSFGLLVLALVIARFCWRLINVEPTHANIASWQKIASYIVHYALYACLFLQPLSGWMMLSTGGHVVSFFGVFNLPWLALPDPQLNKLMVTLHWGISWLMIGLLCAHVGAALLHHFYYKDNILKRMLP